jgi:hypothetical protein
MPVSNVPEVRTSEATLPTHPVYPTGEASMFHQTTNPLYNRVQCNEQQSPSTSLQVFDPSARQQYEYPQGSVSTFNDIQPHQVTIPNPLEAHIPNANQSASGHRTKRMDSNHIANLNSNVASTFVVEHPHSYFVGEELKRPSTISNTTCSVNPFTTAAEITDWPECVKTSYTAWSTGNETVIPGSDTAQVFKPEMRPGYPIHVKTSNTAYSTTSYHNQNAVPGSNSAHPTFPPGLSPRAFIDRSTVAYDKDEKDGVVKTVGQGSFGQVISARLLRDRCGKACNISVVVKVYDRIRTSFDLVYEEAKTLIFLQDTGFVPIFYGIVDVVTTEYDTIGLVQECVGHGLTLDRLLCLRPNIALSDWLMMAQQLCEGLSCFHARNILVNDIKADNVLIEMKISGYTIKYVDFGLATYKGGCQFATPGDTNLKKYYHLAPEVRQAESTTMLSDVYSLGYILDEIRIFGPVPELEFVVKMCMQYIPSDRISARCAKALLFQSEGIAV